MESDVKAYRGETHDKKTLHGTDTHVGRVTFKAENELDAVQLAGLVNAWFNLTPCEHLREHRKKVMTEFCEKHKLTLTVKK